MKQINISIEEEATKGYAIAKDENDKEIGRMTYSKASEDYIIIDHTEVDSSARGEDVGKKMLYKIVDMLRSKNKKVIPLCPFADAMFKKNEDIQDVLKE